MERTDSRRRDSEDRLVSQLTLGLSQTQANRLRALSVGVNIVGFLVFLSGDVVTGAVFKIAAEVLRVPFFAQTRAWDMIWLGVFFVVASVASIVLRLF